MKVDINLLKQLREETFAPIKDCKDALVESDWDFDKAQEILKKKWALTAAKKSDRETKEWLVKAIKDDNRVYSIKLSCETDFVAKNQDFLDLMDKILDILKTHDWEFENISQINQDLFENTIDPLIKENIWKIGENIKLSDAFIKSWNWHIYTHPGSKVVAIVFYKSDNKDAQDVAKEIALQVAAMNPVYLNIESIDQENIDTMKQQFAQELKWSNKPNDIIEKIVIWKLQKSYSESVLLEQTYIRDEKKKIKEIIPDGFELLNFKRFSI